MAYTNSKMVVHTKLSPNHSGQRTHCIDRISPHCVVKAPTKHPVITGSIRMAGSDFTWRRRTDPGVHLLMQMTREQ